VIQVIASLVRFRSAPSDDEVLATFEERADRYRAVPGLVEKIYLRFGTTGQFGALYVWGSEEALVVFRESELARTIPDVYQVTAPPQSELADVCLIVRPRTQEPPVGGPRRSVRESGRN
jgi:hypothetical protein